MARDDKNVGGEGNREADRHYREGAKKHTETGDVAEEAAEARESVEKHPVEMDQAERKGKVPAKDHDPEVTRKH